MTYLECVNSVLRRLREQEVTTWKGNEYSRLIGEFVNDAIIQIENAWDWSMLRASVRVTTTDGVFSYTLPDVYWNSEISNIISDDGNFYLRYVSQDWMSDRYLNQGELKGSPTHYTVNGTDEDGNAIVDVYPKPDAPYTLYVEVVKRTHRVETDNETIIVPWFPVVQLAYAFAIRERGEVGSDMVTEQLAAAKNALSDAVAIDVQRNRTELDWKVV